MSKHKRRPKQKHGITHQVVASQSEPGETCPKAEVADTYQTGQNGNIAASIYQAGPWKTIGLVLNTISVLVGIAVGLLALYTSLVEGTLIREKVYLILALLVLVWLIALAVRIMAAKSNASTSPGVSPKKKTPVIWYGWNNLVLWGVPCLLIVTFIGYKAWELVPSKEVVILVADIENPMGNDPADMADGLAENIQEVVSTSDNIRVVRVPYFVDGTAENSRRRALSIAQLPEYKATIVIWGSYAQDKTAKVNLGIEMVSEIVDQYRPFYLNRLDERFAYVPPDLIPFQVEVGKELGRIAGTIVGILRFHQNMPAEALKILNSSVEMDPSLVGESLVQTAKLFRGLAFLQLGQNTEAMDALASVVGQCESVDNSNIIEVTAAVNLGVAMNNEEAFAAAARCLAHADPMNLSLPYASYGGLNVAMDLSVANEGMGNFETAYRYMSYVYDGAHDLGDTNGANYSEWKKADLLAKAGRTEEGRSLLESYASRAEQEGRYESAISALTAADSISGTTEIAMSEYRYWIAQIYAKSTNPEMHARWMRSAALHAKQAGDYPRAIAYLGETLEAYEMLGDIAGLIDTLESLGFYTLAQNRDNTADAIMYYTEAADLDLSSGANTWSGMIALHALFSFTTDLGDSEQPCILFHKYDMQGRDSSWESIPFWGPYDNYEQLVLSCN